MILKHSHSKLKFTKKGKLHNSCKLAKPIYEVKCDKCNKVFEDKSIVFERRIDLIDKEYCGKCSRPFMASRAGIKGTYNEDGTLKYNKGHFSRERVDAMTDEEYNIFKKQRQNASKNFHKMLNDNPTLKEEHYKKIFKNSTIGYISKAQQEIGNILAVDGFLVEQFVEGMMCDIVNYEKKIIIEYNGDLFHANPRIYKPTDYIEMIKMTAEEKWKKDRAKNFRLRGFGWQVIVIWENEWNNNRKNVLDKFETFKNKDWDLPKWWEVGESGKSKMMKNIRLDKNKYVKLSEVDEYLSNGWEYGTISRKGKK